MNQLIRCIYVAVILVVTASLGVPSAAAKSAQRMALHPVPWTVGGEPILGTYGAGRVEDLERVRDRGRRSRDELRDLSLSDIIIFYLKYFR